MHVGILGAGQLAMMLASAATKLGIHTLCFTDQENTPASHHSEIFNGDLNNENDLRSFAKQVDVITLENEFINTDTLQFLKQYKPIYPDEKALSVTQDRVFEKRCFNQLNIPCADYHTINTTSELKTYAEQFDYQCILKTRTLGYDGKGQWHISNANELKTAIEELGDTELNLILEKKVNFDTEVSIIASRSTDGSTIHYPLTENQHKQGILRQSNAPYQHPDLQTMAIHYANKLLNHLNYIGTIAIEFFIADNQLIANEIAPRVHNSGHWTIEGATHSQFDNHIRAITDLPLGAPEVSNTTTLFNIIGNFPQALKNEKEAYIYDYFKTERPGRKLGHVTITNAQERKELLTKIKSELGS